MSAIKSIPEVVQQRHKPPTQLEAPRPLVVACAQLQSGVNLSQIVRVAGSCGLTRVIACGPAKLGRKITRQAIDTIFVERRRSLEPSLQRLASSGYELVALEQSESAEPIFDFNFHRKTVLVLGNERAGLSSKTLSMVHRVAEIPVFGLPYSYNVAMAATISLYEYCRQFPRG